MIERSAQAAVVIVLERDEAERLQHAIRRLLRGAEYLRHAVYRALLSLKGDLDKVAATQRTRQLQQAACG